MSAPLWTSEDIELATGGTASAPFHVTGSVSIDTRSLKPGDLFVALKDQRDGHDFADAAFKAGAAGALVARPVSGGAYVQTSDVLDALTQLGIAARVRCGAHRTAITGSAGKTSVKEMLARIYRAFGPAHWSDKSFNNHWGVPLTLARMPEATARAVFEIGMNTPGEIAPRSEMVRPHTGLITCIAAAHLEGLGSIEGVAEEKSNIFAGLEASGTIILPADDAFLDYLTDRARDFCPTGNVETFGASSDATARILAYDTDGRTSRIELDIVGRRAVVTLDAVGAHWAQNVAAALLAASQADLNVADCAEALSGYAPPPGRGTAERLVLPDIGEITLIDDAYNANPASMRAALQGLAERTGARRLAALGDMREIGDASAAEHRALAGPVVEAGVTGIFLAGAEMQHLSEALPPTLQQTSAPTSDELWIQLQKALRAGDVLLIKGSNASGMSKLADRLRQWSVSAGTGKMEDDPEGVAGAG
ncbi:MAG: UDP-N-acetylmuramoyl-tripeptide--D-alanyl-D-alanine ligase [Hyphomonas sp.]